MDDDEWVFARRLGLLVGRLDWWRLKGEHTPYEWQLQRIAQAIDPLGVERDDMRSARMTVRLLAAQVGGMTNSDATEEYDNLKAYVIKDIPQDKTLTPEEAARLKRDS